MRTRPIRTAWLLASALLTVAATVTSAPAQLQSLATAPDAVEEDWVLVIGNPDPLGVGPQITTVMSPTSDPTRSFIAFDMNYREYPVFFAGGVSTQVWSKGQITAFATQGSSVFGTNNETVTWTQRMSFSGGVLTYDINNGQSTTFGQFGQGLNLQVTHNTDIPDLSGYSPSYSASKSGASWESNLVTSLTLKQVRYYANGQLLRTDTNPRVLISSNDDQ
jgi:hypothetical protein